MGKGMSYCSNLNWFIPEYINPRIDVPPTGINPVNVIMVMNVWSDKNTLLRKGTEISISYFNTNLQMTS